MGFFTGKPGLTQSEEAGPSKSAPKEPHIYSNVLPGLTRSSGNFSCREASSVGFGAPEHRASLQGTHTSIVDQVLLPIWPPFFTRHLKTRTHFQKSQATLKDKDSLSCEDF